MLCPIEQALGVVLPSSPTRMAGSRPRTWTLKPSLPRFARQHKGQGIMFTLHTLSHRSDNQCYRVSRRSGVTPSAPASFPSMDTVALVSALSIIPT